MTIANSYLPSLPKQAIDLRLDDLHEGREVIYSWRTDTNAIESFANLTGDLNPLHMDNDYAVDNGYEGRVIHGFLLGAKVSGLIGMALPGRRCLLIEETLSFPAPVYIGDTVVFRLVINEVHRDLSLIILKVYAKKREQTVLRGHLTCKILF